MAREGMRTNMIRVALVAVSVGCVGGCSRGNEDEFATPESGVRVFVEALRTGDDATLRKVLGPEAEGLISSGDEVADQRGRDAFVQFYDQKHRVETEGDTATLLVGEGEWPFPITMVKDGEKWRFDVEAGKEEILARRIGRNELAVIEVCRAVVDAQKEYAESNPGGLGEGVYARQFASDPGKKNGLYWETAEGEEPSPMGPMVAEAVATGYAAPRAGERRPYHGYYFRPLDAQGSAAPGGAKSYVEDGKLSGGFAVVAWPAEYDNSGIMTFLVNQSGVVYQKDLGEGTAKVASEMVVFDPGEGWEIVK
jgi:hypothetical protein